MKKVVLLGMALSAAVFASDGAAIFKKCATCHGANGAMVYAGKVPALAGQESAVLIEKLTAYKNGTANAFGMGPVMQAQAKMNLKTDEDVKAVAEYVSALK